jgi:hypothetical protein
MMNRNHPSGQQLRRQSAQAFAGLFTKQHIVTEGRSSLAADFVPTAPDDDNDMSPPAKDGATASIPFVCEWCTTRATLHKKPRFCLKCGKPALPVESTATGDPSRRVVEADGVVKKRVEASNLLELRRAVGNSIPDRPVRPAPLTAKSLRGDMERLAGRAAQLDALERAAIDALAKK